ncbi:protein NRT1/ PTR FAMILY 2.13-like [Impatiens glandulifera]|uniref:protein NRT1/ PTR FAMILY 2.13-like n=1 Tax=Impatiens glandulifera TaxID=253017 RepID=UPI001FB0E141|nr:protein NRT1/ PTR FAMILY 2.13-like [Impatiens glandulifera]XP_047326428.1 protein NRT1/ PTR FAMILY 2.13-like [Impatiens glandulifera]
MEHHDEIRSWHEEEDDDADLHPFSVDSTTHDEINSITIDQDELEKKPQGWKAIIFILGTEICEKIATYSVGVNLGVFLIDKCHIDEERSTRLATIFSLSTYFSPLLGAIISDAVLGRFRTIFAGSCFTLTGMITLVLTASVPQLDRWVLWLGLTMLVIGSGGIRACCLPFGLEQFKCKTRGAGKRTIGEYFNWYFATWTLVSGLGSYAIVHIQNNGNWVGGFVIPTLLMFLSIVFFLVGEKYYLHTKQRADNIVFGGVVQVLWAAWLKRGLRVLPGSIVMYYDLSPREGTTSSLRPTDYLRFLNTAAIVGRDDLKLDGTRANTWRLRSVQEIEQVKRLIQISSFLLPTTLFFVPSLLTYIYIAPQLSWMNCHGISISLLLIILISIPTVISTLTVFVYDRVITGFLISRLRCLHGSVTLLQRIGAGIACVFLSMGIAGLVEAVSSGSTKDPISVFWLTPQLIMMGVGNALGVVGQINFFYQECPESVGSHSISLVYLSQAVALCITVGLLEACETWVSGEDSHIYYFYLLIAAIEAINMIIYLGMSRRYQYRNHSEDDIHGASGIEEVLSSHGQDEGDIDGDTDIEGQSSHGQDERNVIDSDIGHDYGVEAIPSMEYLVVEEDAVQNHHPSSLSVVVSVIASDYPREYDGACVQMRRSYSPAAQLFLFLVQWSDCHLAGAPVYSEF